VARWLVKEEPSHYSFDDLVRDGRTEWGGVLNALALRHLRAFRPGDTVLYYHSGDVRSVVGIAEVTRAARPETVDGRPSWTPEIAARTPLGRPVPLSTLRSDPRLSGFDLLRIGRLSVMPVSD
jgi:predicted RNA-binding protein with PUA-like domain